MDTLAARPPLNDLYEFIGRVKKYPVSIEKLLDMAFVLEAPSEIVGFYTGFKPRMVFKNKDELLGCSEQVDILRAERSDMPKEEERSPEEY